MSARESELLERARREGPKARGILFKDRLVLAILSGAKTQTRRLVKGPVLLSCRCGEPWPDVCDRHGPPRASARVACPYGQPGDRLWVREAWAPCEVMDEQDPPEFVRFRADNSCWCPEGAVPPSAHLHPDPPRRWRTPIHLPRVCARLWLEVTAVRLERLHAITEADALAEGAPGAERGREGLRYVANATWVSEQHPLWGAGMPPSARAAFACGWDSIHPREGSWGENPWVWVVTFRKLEDARG